MQEAWVAFAKTKLRSGQAFIGNPGRGSKVERLGVVSASPQTALIEMARKMKICRGGGGWGVVA